VSQTQELERPVSGLAGGQIVKIEATARLDPDFQEAIDQLIRSLQYVERRPKQAPLRRAIDVRHDVTRPA
jgi:hypothetical protein